jgi:hypothetical protein
MNERIRELAEQCHHRYSEHNIDLEKFAELIVRECAEKCVYVVDRQEILAHFGVEE